MKISFAAALALAASVSAQELLSCRIQSQGNEVFVTDPALCSAARGRQVAGQCCVGNGLQRSDYAQACGERGDSSGNRGEVIPAGTC
ncbi:EC85 protein [Colletotrichum higginsianum IMI 349063]|uniref:EC85 protein n=2 Tax=Colletotrichum higginsianum TaxID=80884 RepID=A0A1B7YHV5_COLHI|nr:EC85 protein [Colletotrichum higginsianum IMI 349063]OBR11540.1 EC85 protein [Colletotrichum higginsianum IMI 349063]TIC99119.1 hypothetical protein CH35J_006276 [Colletotrichum higginsianum]